MCCPVQSGPSTIITPVDVGSRLDQHLSTFQPIAQHTVHQCRTTKLVSTVHVSHSCWSIRVENCWLILIPFVLFGYHIHSKICSQNPSKDFASGNDHTTLMIYIKMHIFWFITLFLFIYLPFARHINKGLCGCQWKWNIFCQIFFKWTC